MKTVSELIESFDGHFRNNDGDVIIRIDFPRYILSPENHEKLKREVIDHLSNIEIGIDTPNALTQLAITVLANSY